MVTQEQQHIGIRILRSVVRVVVAVVAAIGIGAAAAAVWLIDALDESPAARPTLQFLRDGDGDVCAPFRGPWHDGADLSRALAASPVHELTATVDAILRCATSDDRAKFIAFLRQLSTRGDRLAARCLDAVIRRSCQDLTIAVSGNIAGAGDAASRCAEVTADAAGLLPMAPSIPQRVLRIAQLAALIDAGIATPASTREFCVLSASTRIPEGFRSAVDRIRGDACSD